MIVKKQEETILGGGTRVCRLPGVTERAEEAAFEGMAFLELILPADPVTLEAGSFFGMTGEALQVTIPSAASEISAEAFAGAGSVTLIARKA